MKINYKELEGDYETSSFQKLTKKKFDSEEAKSKSKDKKLVRKKERDLF